MTARFDWSNFHDASTADFASCAVPERPADFVSASGSRYWREGAGVVRASDHWGAGIRSCNWYLAGASDRGPAAAGFCAWSDFCAEPAQCEAWRLERAALERAYEERRHARAAEEARLAALLVPGSRITATRTVTERINARRFATVTHRVTFTLAKITPRFYIAADGRRFARHTLTALAAAAEEVRHA